MVGAQPPPTICRRAADATMMRKIFGLPFHVLLLWIEIEIMFCSYLLLFLFCSLQT